MDLWKAARHVSIGVPALTCVGFLAKAAWHLKCDQGDQAMEALKVAAIAGGSAIAAILASEAGDHLAQKEKS